MKRWNDKSQAAIASELAAEIYGPEIIQKNIEDAAHNTTRFLVVSRDKRIPKKNSSTRHITSFTFEVRITPASLYKTLARISHQQSLPQM